MNHNKSFFELMKLPEEERIKLQNNHEKMINNILQLRNEFEKMAFEKLFILTRNNKGEYINPATFYLWAGYWECAVKNDTIPDKIEYINTG